MNIIKAREQIASVRALRREQEELLQQLERSLALMELWPDAFKCGKLTASFSGVRDSLRVQYKRDDGETRTYKLKDLPEVLWPQWYADERRNVNLGLRSLRRRRP